MQVGATLQGMLSRDNNCEGDLEAARNVFDYFHEVSCLVTIDVRSRHGLRWSPDLTPIENSPFDKEPFQTWWKRHQGRLGNLHPLIAEQWVYRHWSYSPSAHLPLERLGWRLEEWSTERILREVAWEDPDADADHEYDFRMFGRLGREPGQTMMAIGTWDIPPVLLEGPKGFLTDRGPMQDTRFWLIEGHLRRRCLNALSHHGDPAAKHKIFVLSLDS